MEGHVRLQDGVVLGPDAKGAFAPVWRVGQTDGIAHAALALDVVFLKNGVEGAGDIACGIAGARGGDACLDAFQHHVLRAQHVGRRLSQKDRPAERCMVAAVASSDLEEGACACFKRFVVPGQVRGSRVLAGWQEGCCDGGVISAELNTFVFGPGDGRVVDFGHQFVLTQARPDHVLRG